MSSTILRHSRAFTLSRRSFVPLTQISRIARFTTTPRSSAMSENDVHHDSASRKTKIDEHKSDSVGKASQGKGEWKQELASSSEASLKNDKHEMSIEEMQKEGAKKGKEESST